MKLYILTFIILCGAVNTNVFSQPVIVNQKTIGGNSADYCDALTTTKDGGVLVGGSSPSSQSGEKTSNSKGGDDYWIVKLNEKNKIEWDHTYGGTGTDVLSALQQTQDGGYILGGYGFSPISGDKTENGFGDWDYWVIKVNSKGDVLWDKTIGGTNDDELTAIQQTRDGGYILGGFSNSRNNGNKTALKISGYDYWVVKIDSAGNIQWDKTYGGKSNDYLWALRQTKDGGYILGGGSESNISGNKTSIKYGASDFWVVKLDNAGNILWDKSYGGSDRSVLHAIKQTGDGGYIFGGHSNSKKTGVKSQESRGLYELLGCESRQRRKHAMG